MSNDRTIELAPGLTKITGKDVLSWSGRIWFTAAAIGHWIFAFYVAALYVPLLIAQGAPGLEETHLPHGYVAGDDAHNGSMIAHLMLSILIVGGGPLQLIPAIRKRFPTFHRWNGRLWMSLAVVTATTGIYMNWTQEPIIGGVNGQIGTTIGGLLILAFAPITLYYAIKRKIAIHHQWAIRLFMVVGVVWFFRIGYQFWAVTVGTNTLEFFKFWYHGQYLVPLLALELYFWATRSHSAVAKYAVAVATLILTLMMSIGIYGATTNMWLARL
ncbi:MAG: DUF2306 domain-containing protein [Pseudomonadota bacterium]